jgi:hypothetical protein
MLAEVGRVGKPREKYVVMGLNSHVPGRSLFSVIDRTVWNDWVQPEAAYFAEWAEKRPPRRAAFPMLRQTTAWFY